MSQPIEKMLEKMSHHAPGSVTSYKETANRFLTWLGNDRIPTNNDYRSYFDWRRRKGIGEWTLRKEFWILQKLAIANKWPWERESGVAPLPKKKPKANVIKPADVERLILAQHTYSKAERFYLAVATTYLVRREALALIKKRNYDDKTLLIHGLPKSKTIRHLIPDVLKPVFAAYRPKERSDGSLNVMFHRIATKAQVNVDRRVAWDAIRQCQNKILRCACVANRIDPRVVAEYAGLSPEQDAREPESSDTNGHSHAEILSKNPYYISRQIQTIHPWLPIWERTLSPDTSRKRLAEASGAQIRDQIGILQLLSEITHPARKPEPTQPTNPTASPSPTPPIDPGRPNGALPAKNGESVSPIGLYNLLSRLIKEGLLPEDTRNVLIVRPDMSKNVQLGLDQLKEAVEGRAKELFFRWTDESHISLSITRGKIHGELLIWAKRMTFTTTLTRFNYASDDDFNVKIWQAKKSLENVYQVKYSNPGPYGVTVELQSQKLLSETNACEFLRAILLAFE